MKDATSTHWILTLLALAALTVTAQAQTVYRVVGPDGKVTFSDRPPPGEAGKVTATTASGKAIDLTGQALPFELRQVAAKYPVTLYTAGNCAPCGTGRALLINRGIPFAEKTVETGDDAEALTRISGENTLPFLTIGAQQIKGYSDAEWTQFLNAAGYPATSILPNSYRRESATPLVAVKKPAPAASAPASKPAVAAMPPQPAVSPENPAGIKF